MRKTICIICLVVSSIIASAIPVTFSCGITIDYSQETLEYLMSKGDTEFYNYLMGMDDFICDQEEEESPECPPEP